MTADHSAPADLAAAVAGTPRKTDAVLHFRDHRVPGPVRLRNWQLSHPARRLRIGGWVVHPDGLYPMGPNIAVDRLDMPGKGSLADVNGEIQVTRREDGDYLELICDERIVAPVSAVATTEEVLLLKRALIEVQGDYDAITADSRSKFVHLAGLAAHWAQLQRPIGSEDAAQVVHEILGASLDSCDPDTLLRIAQDAHAWDLRAPRDGTDSRRSSWAESVQAVGATLTGLATHARTQSSIARAAAAQPAPGQAHVAPGGAAE